VHSYSDLALRINAAIEGLLPLPALTIQSNIAFALACLPLAFASRIEFLPLPALMISAALMIAFA
jgi:hypothetical protein